MRRLLIKSFLIAIIGTTLVAQNLFAATKEAASKIEELEKKAPKIMTLPELEKGKLKNGIRYYILPEHELPIIKATVYIKGGTVFDPAGKSGLATTTAALLQSGGTMDMSPDAVDEFLDKIASSIGIEAGKDHLIATIASRTDKFDESLLLLLDMLFRPRLDEGRFNLIKKQLIDSVKRRDDSPEGLAATGFKSLLYGRDNPWGEYSTQSSVNAITIDDIKEYHKDHFQPKNIIIGIAGDIDSKKVIRLIESYQNFAKNSGVELEFPNGEPNPRVGIHIIDKESNQAVLNIGQEGTFRFNPDKYSLIIMNDILGGSGFKARLSSIIRVEKGLAYSVWSSYEFGPRMAPGSFKIYLATKIDSASQALDLVISELERFTFATDITKDELKYSKDSTLNSLVFEYASASNIVTNVVRFNYFGYPDNYVEEFAKMIGEVNLDDVIKTARKYLHPDKMQIVLVGDKNKLKKQFTNHMNIDYLTIEE